MTVRAPAREPSDPRPDGLPVTAARPPRWPRSAVCLARNWHEAGPGAADRQVRDGSVIGAVPIAVGAVVPSPSRRPSATLANAGRDVPSPPSGGSGRLRASEGFGGPGG